MPELILVFVGGGIGSLLRFIAGKFFTILIPSFPIATLISNMSGAFVLGFAFAIYNSKNMSSNNYLFISTGICGGFSTFSSFTLDNFQLLQAGNYFAAIINICLNLSLSLITLMAGIFIAKFFS